MCSCNLCRNEICRQHCTAHTLYKVQVCDLRSSDLGIPVGSAVKTASTLNIDNRIMFSAGSAAIALGLLPHSTIAFGIPLSVTGKSPYFDR